MPYTVFDTETTGIPTGARVVTLKRLAAWDTCRLVSIAIAVFNDDHSENSRFTAVVKPDGFKVEATEVHGISHELAEAEGIPFIDAYNVFVGVFQLCPTVVGHNVSFDINVLKAECLRRNMDTSIFDRITPVCTLGMARRMFLEPVNKLGVLYKKFFGEDLEGAHDAMVDTMAAARLYAFMTDEPRKSDTIPVRKVILKASDIAACVGLNSYKKPYEVMCDLWKRFMPETFTGETRLEVQEKALKSSVRSQSILAKAIATIPKNSEEASEVRAVAMKQIDDDESLSNEDKVNIKDLIRYKVNTNHGIRSEDKTADLDERDLKEDPTFYKYPVVTIANTVYEIVGRIDRYYVEPDGTRVLVEIKNRMNGLFKRIRDYENVQVQTYLAMTGMAKAKLIEQYNDARMSHDIAMDNELWSDTLGTLKEFCRTLHHNMCGN